MPTPPAPDSSPVLSTAAAPGNAVVIRRAALKLPVTGFVTRATGLGLGLAGAAVRVVGESLQRIEGSATPYTPPTVRPLGRILRAVPGLMLAGAYATRAGAIAAVARVEGAVHRSSTGLPSFVDGPLTPVADAVDDINRWAFGEQRYNELLVTNFVRTSAPVVAEELVTRIDLPNVVRQIPMQRIASEIDVQGILAEIDINAIIAHIDIGPIADQVLDEIDIAGIIRSTTGSLTGQLIEANRGVFMRIDAGIATVADSVIRPRHRRSVRLTNYDATAIEDRPGADGGTDAPRTDTRARVIAGDAISSSYARDRQGWRAGFASRIITAGIDLLVILALAFLAGVLVAFFRVLFAADVFSLPRLHWSASVSITAVLSVVYYTASWTTIGRTIGDAIMGLRVVTEQGRRVRFWRSLTRALLVTIFGTPLMFWCIVSKKNAALYDLPLRTTVVYDWTIN